ncbi:Prolyl endopeptidase [Aphelenchoides besseyi]|nr:Prolyl endopeptidase [Aphelenchoides besseyi]
MKSTLLILAFVLLCIQLASAQFGWGNGGGNWGSGGNWGGRGGGFGRGSHERGDWGRGRHSHSHSHSREHSGEGRWDRRGGNSWGGRDGFNRGGMGQGFNGGFGGRQGMGQGFNNGGFGQGGFNNGGFGGNGWGHYYYTHPKRLAIGSRSNGGSLVAVCAQQAPRLFGAVITVFGFCDLYRYHKFTIGSAWMSEYGDAEKPEYFEFLRK